MEEGDGGAAVRLKRKGWVLETLRGKNLRGLVMDWVGKVRWKA